MSDHKPLSWFYPKPTGDPGRDRNARTIQFACLLLAFAISTVVVLNTIAQEPRETPLLVIGVAGLLAAVAMNRAGRWEWAARIAVLAVLLTVILLVFEARDGFRSHAMLVFPLMLLLSVMLLDRASYLTTAGVVLVAVAALGIAEKHGLTAAIPLVRTPTSYDSIFFVDLTLLVFALIGSRIARDVQSNVVELHATIDRLSAANLELRGAAEAQRDSEERFRATFMNSADALLIVTLEEGTILDVNGAFEALYGFTREEAVGKTTLQLQLYSQAADRARALAEVRAKRQLRDFEAVARKKSGVEFNASLSADTFILGGKWHLASAVRDITERKQAERALREHERQLASIYNTVRDVIFHLAVEPEGQFRFASVNAAFLRVTGLSQDAVVGKTVNEILPEPSLTMVLGKYRQAVEENAIVSWEETSDYAIGRLTGEVSVAPVFDNTGTCTHLVGSVHDITERTHAEAALRESEERFRTMADTVPVIIFQNDAAGKATFFNRQAIAFTGRTLEQLAGYGWLETIHPDDLERTMASHRASLERPVMGQRELRLRRSDGQYRWMLVTSSPLFVGAQFTGYLGTIVDITDLKRSHGELLEAQKLESLGVLAGGIAHDFNNMLGAILAQSELVLAELGDDSLARAGIAEIRRITLRGSDMVRQLMAYAGQDTTEFRSVDLAAIIGGMVQLLRLSVSKHARLDLDLPRDLPAIRANAAQIGQVVVNLVMNGSEAIGERDGVIGVRATRLAIGLDSAQMDAVSLPQGEYVRLEISDTGCGIPEEIRFRIFDPFFTTKFTGRGLGLAVVQGIVRGHRGAINVFSSPGAGTVFEVYLPAADEPVRGDDVVQKLASVPRESAGPRRVVFVIEDEESLRNAVCKMLRKRNFSVFEAADGSAAVEIFRARHADIGIVLLDLTMPGLGGREVLGELKRIRPDVKIIVTTAYSQNAAAASLDSERGWAFIRKPYQIADLIHLLHKGLGS